MKTPMLRRRSRLQAPRVAQQNRTVVIAGASCGMGLATAYAFARRGWNVVLAARRQAELQDAVARCQKLGGRALAVVADVTDPGDMQRLARQATEQFGPITAWVNMAGLSLWGRFEDIPVEAQTRLIQVNLNGVINGSHAAVRAMLNEGGVIINVASFAGRMPVPFSTAYTASKYGVAGFTGALRDELSVRSNVAVCGVYPTFVDTPTDLHSANFTGRQLRPLPPLLKPEYVAEQIVMLTARPKRALHLGLQHLLAPGYLFAPETVGRLAGRLLQHFLFRTGAPARTTEGILFQPMPQGTGTRGGWGRIQQRRRRNASIGLIGLAGVAALLLTSKSAARPR